MATKTSGEIEKEFIDSLESSTSRNLGSWMNEIKTKDIEKRNDIVKFLKEENGFGHMNANLLVGIYLNGGKRVYGNTAELLENQFAKAEAIRPLYDAVVKFVQNAFPGAIILPKKTYVSILEKREFAAVNIKRQELRIGFDLGGRVFDETVSKSKLTGPMPRISHQVVVTEANQLNGEFVQLLQDSYDRSN